MKISKFLTTAAIAAVLCLHASPASAAPEVATPLRYELMDKAVYKEDAPTVFPAELMKLEGKRVRVSGFVVPYDDPEKMSKFLMVKSTNGCFYCNPPGENEVLFIRLSAKEKPPEMDGEKLVVEGTLHLRNAESKDEEAKQFVFTIDDAKLIPAGH
ncbi:MAG: DUF3299 domain-containing protein [Luteolibacter sp.]